MVDERGVTIFNSTAFLAKIKLLGRYRPALFTAGHVFDLTMLGVDAKTLRKVHMLFNNLKVWLQCSAKRKTCLKIA